MTMTTQTLPKIPLAIDAYVAQLQTDLFDAASADSVRTFDLDKMLCSPELLRFAATQVAQAKGGNAPGSDGVVLRGMAETALAKMLKDLAADIDSEQYQPSPVKTVVANEGDGAEIAILTARDRILQQGLSLLFYPLVESELSDSSYGGRPGIEPRDALLDIAMAIRKVSGQCFIIRAGADEFFERISHARLEDVLSRRILDKKVRSIISKQLSMWGSRPGYGLPQGAPLSSLMTNWYLASIDRFFEGKSDIVYFRYLGEFVIVVPGTVPQAQSVLEDLEGELNRLELRLDATTRIAEVTAGVEFLGVHIRRNTATHAEIQIAEKSYEDAVRQINHISSKPLGVNIMGEQLRAAIAEWFAYYAEFSSTMAARARTTLERRASAAINRGARRRPVPAFERRAFVSFGSNDIPTCNAIAENARVAAATLSALKPKDVPDEGLYLCREQAQNSFQGWCAELLRAQRQFREFKIQRRQMNEHTKATLASLAHAEHHTVMAYLLETVKMNEATQELEQAIRTWPLFWEPLISVAQGAIEAIDDEIERRRISAESALLLGDARTGASALARLTESHSAWGLQRRVAQKPERSPAVPLHN
jgi:retron-type reverse transcriptase